MNGSISSLLANPFIAAILVYLLVLVGVGVYKGRGVKNSADFMVAGRTLPWWVLVGTLLATWIGNGSLFGGAGLGYRNGMAALWYSGGAWLGIMMVYFIAKRVRNFAKVTVPDIFEARYGTVAGILATIITVVAYLTIVSYQFRGGGRVLSIVSEGGISVEAGIVITAVFAITYTILAGMVSVVYTDVVNGVIMIFGVIIALFFMVAAVGGLPEVVAAAEAAGKWSVFGNWANERGSGGSGPLIAISFLVPTMLLLMGDANVYQRIFSAQDGGTARKAVLFWVVGVIFLESGVAFLGLTGSVAASQGLLPELFVGGMANTTENLSENVIPEIALGAVPIWVGMTLVATMMAIIVSTADSFLLVPATNLTRDVYQRFMAPDAPERRVVFISRALVLFLGLVAYLLVDQFPTILAAAYTAYLVYGSGITPALLAAFLWKRATTAGAISSVLSGAGVTLLWTFFLSNQPYFGTWPPFLQEVTYPAVFFSVTSLIVVSLLTPRPPKEAWEPFFRDDPLPLEADLGIDVR
ncbi:MAG: sodium:solute symporter family protein [Gemmatimonadota bacterium]